MKVSIFLFCLVATAQLRPFLDFSKSLQDGQGTAGAVVTDAAGNVIVSTTSGSTLLGSGWGDASIRVLDASGNLRCTTTLPQSSVSVLFAGPDGYVYAGGATGNRQFPVVNAWEPSYPGGSGFLDYAGFLMKFQPCGGVQFATYLGEASTVSGIGVSGAGDVFVTGSTSSAKFPTTLGVIQPATPVPGPWPLPAISSFVSKFSSDGRRLIYSTYLGGSQRHCSGGSNCVSVRPDTYGNAIVVTPLGEAVVAGRTNTLDFPTTPNAPLKQCECYQHNGNGYVSRLNSDATALLYSTYLQGARRAITVSLGAAGSIWVAGTDAIYSLPTTPDALQRISGDGEGGSPSFLTQIAADGTLSYVTYFGGQQGTIRSVARSVDGSIWLTGNNAGTDFPLTAGTFSRGGEFLTRLTADARSISFSTQLPAGLGSGDVAPTGTNSVYLGGAPSRLSKLTLRSSTAPALLGVANAAYGSVQTCVSPGEIVSIYGIDIGTREPSHYRLDGLGRIAGDLDGVRLYFNGIAAPLLYAQLDQINAVTPFALPESGEVTLALVHNGTEIRDVLRMCGRPSSLELFRAPQEPWWSAAAVNPDGTINSFDNPAPRGSVVSVYLTGAGPWSPPPADGEITPLQADPDRLKFRITGDGEILYAGPAPGQVAGLIQVNVRPQSEVVQLRNEFSSASAHIYVRP